MILRFLGFDIAIETASIRFCLSENHTGNHNNSLKCILPDATAYSIIEINRKMSLFFKGLFSSQCKNDTGNHRQIHGGRAHSFT